MIPDTSKLLLITITLLISVNQQTSAKGIDSLQLSRERLVFQTKYGDIHMAFFPEVAPVTVEHIRRLGELGCYTSNHFFRVDKGFVAQTADILGGRTVPLNDKQRAEAYKHVPVELRKDVKHDRRGILSMARSDDPNSGGSSFSILLGAAPHLDMTYTVFGIVTDGLDVMTAMEGVDTIREGIFVMPKERIEILSTYMYVVSSNGDGDDASGVAVGSARATAESQLYCTEALSSLQSRYDAQAMHLHEERQKKLPGN